MSTWSRHDRAESAETRVEEPTVYVCIYGDPQPVHVLTASAAVPVVVMNVCEPVMVNHGASVCACVRACMRA